MGTYIQNLIWNLKQVPKMQTLQNWHYLPTFPPRFRQFGQVLKTSAPTKGLAMSALHCSTLSRQWTPLETGLTRLVTPLSPFVPFMIMPLVYFLTRLST